MCSLEEAHRRPHHFLQTPDRRWVLASPSKQPATGKREWPQAAPGEVTVGHQEEFLH